MILVKVWAIGSGSPKVVRTSSKRTSPDLQKNSSFEREHYTEPKSSYGPFLCSAVFELSLKILY